MNKIQEMNECGRAEQLVDYLYGESDARERTNFEQHLSACAACREELAAFGQVREAVGTWRAELLTRAPAVAAAEVIPVAHPSRVTPAMTDRRTAWDALREFFALSPAWLRYGSVAASLVVCALAVLAVANAQVRFENGNFAFSTGWSRAMVESPVVLQNANAPDAMQSQQLVAERDAALHELQETRAQLEDSRAANIDAIYREISDGQPAREMTSAATNDLSSRPRRSVGAQRKVQRRALQSEDDLPRLIDLLGSGN